MYNMEKYVNDNIGEGNKAMHPSGIVYPVNWTFGLRHFGVMGWILKPLWCGNMWELLDYHLINVMETYAGGSAQNTYYTNKDALYSLMKTVIAPSTTDACAAAYTCSSALYTALGVPSLYNFASPQHVCVQQPNTNAGTCLVSS